MRDYKKINAWKLADDLTVEVYQHTKDFPGDERFGLTSQLRRAAYSVPANIAEGSSRKTKKDYLHFLYIARGSAAETEYFVHLSHRLGYMDGAIHDELKSSIGSTQSCLYGLIRAVEKEIGPIGRTTAKLTSLLVLTIQSISVKDAIS